MQDILKAIPVASDALPAKANTDLAHLPGPNGHWLTGNIKELLPNPGPLVRSQQAKFGNCFSVGFFRNKRAVFLTGTAANELVLLDRENIFSSRWGWEVVLAFFGRNILVRDFQDHRQHRKLMTPAFKPDALASYLEQMAPIIDQAVNAYTGKVDVYRRTKQMVLDIAIEVFAGVPVSPETTEWNTDLDTVLSNAMAHRLRLPGTAYSKALKARDRLRLRLLAELPSRRSGSGHDMFSVLAAQRDENGTMLSDNDVIDHMFGMLFAAHDTTASALGMMLWLLARHRDWQDRLREECLALHSQTGASNLSYDDLKNLSETEWVIKETLRLYAPLQIIPRRPVRDFEFEGQTIPANSTVFLPLQAVHFDPELFPNPDTFAPERFDPQQSTDRAGNPFAFLPFGRGSHMCIGMHFAYMEIKAVIYQILLNRRLEPVPGDDPNFEYLPIMRPGGALNVQFSPIK